jgi:DNA end-binding protein Ku
MARPLWQGSLSFGLVNIPVEVHRAVRDHRPRFRMLHKKDLSPVHRGAGEDESHRDRLIR